MSAAGPGIDGDASWDDIARAASRGDELAAEHEEPRQLIVFEMDSAPYAVPVERVREIVRMRPITPIPRMPVEIHGVISLRGEIVQVVDLRRRLSLEPAEPTVASRVVIVHGEDGRVAGLRVDRVVEVLRVLDADVRPVAASENGAVEALCARGDEFVSLIDLDRVLDIDAGD